MESRSSRPKKTDIVRKRTGCQNCRNKRKKCDETHPECLACTRRGIKCGGYQRPVTFKDVTSLAAESSKRFEEERWAALRLEDGRRKRRRLETTGEPSSQAFSRSEGAVVRVPVDANDLSSPGSAPLPPWHTTNANGWLGGSFALPWALFDTHDGPEPRDLFPEIQAPEEAKTSDDEFLDPKQIALDQSLDSQEPALLSERPHGDSTTSADIQSFTLTTAAGDDFLFSESPSSESTYSVSPPMGEPNVDCQLSLPLEEALIQHFDRNVVPLIPVTIAFPNLFSQSSCFRAAVLALASSNLKLSQTLPLDAKALRRVYDDRSVWSYYDTAVKGLQQHLQNVERHRGEELAGAALLLAYHEFEAGTALGIRNHATGLDAIASKLDFAASSTPDLFKAWRMLRCDVQLMMAPNRRTCNVVDNYDVSSLLDPQLAIRDILLRLHRLQTRHAMESSFCQDAGADGASASEKAARWLSSILDRECDRRIIRQRDFHRESLTPESILQQCDVLSRRLDTWHKSLCAHDMPVANLGTDRDFVSGPTFETLVTYRFADDRKAVEYMMYLVCRITCNYLRSLFDASFSAAASETWAKVILGIACGMNVQRQQFTVLRVDSLLQMTAAVCDGTNFATTVLDYLVPKVIASGLSGPDIVAWASMKSLFELDLREKRKGRAIRATVEGIEEHSEMWQLVNRHPVAVFGDCYGKGHFRDCHVIECLS